MDVLESAVGKFWTSTEKSGILQLTVAAKRKKNAKVWQNLTVQAIQGFDVTFHANAGRIILTPSELPLKRRINHLVLNATHSKQKIMP